jgi:putative SOS response-associated peptidase YedK
MCTNYNNNISQKDIQKFFKKLKTNIDYDNEYSEDEYQNLKQDNIRMTNNILSIKLIDNKPNFTIMGWSINWNPKMPIYNSRIETIRSEKRWTTIFNAGRCLVPATMFYEYRPFENDPAQAVAYKKEHKIKKKSRFGIEIPDVPFFMMGGIYVFNNDKNYCSIITTEPHKDMKQIPHHRCPYIMNAEESLEFLHGEPQYLLDNIQHYSNEKSLEIKQVSEY